MQPNFTDSSCGFQFSLTFIIFIVEGKSEFKGIWNAVDGSAKNFYKRCGEEENARTI